MDINNNIDWDKAFKQYMRELEAKKWSNLKDKDIFLMELEDYLKHNRELSDDSWVKKGSFSIGKWNEYLVSLMDECINYLKKYNIPNIEDGRSDYACTTFGLIINNNRYECTRLQGQGCVDIIRVDDANRGKYDLEYDRVIIDKEPPYYETLLKGIIEKEYNLKDLGYEVVVRRVK